LGESGLYIDARGGVGGEVGVGEFDLDGFVVVRVGGRRCGDGDAVVGAVFCDAAFEELRDAGAVEDEAAGLRGDDLEAEIAEGGVGGFAEAVEEALVVEDAFEVFGGSVGIDVIESDAGGMEEGGEAEGLREDVLLLFIAEQDAGAGEEWPAGREEEDELATGRFAQLSGELAETVERDVDAFGGAIEAGGTIDGAEADGVVVEGGPEGIAVLGEGVVKLHAFVREDGEGGGVGEVAFGCGEELGELDALVADLLVSGVDGVEDDDDGEGFAGGVDGVEGDDGGGKLVGEDGEVGGLEIGDGGSGFVGDCDVEEKGSRGGGGGGLRGCKECGGEKDGREANCE
jgi:hypothetical protein